MTSSAIKAKLKTVNTKLSDANAAKKLLQSKIRKASTTAEKASLTKSLNSVKKNITALTKQKKSLNKKLTAATKQEKSAKAFRSSVKSKNNSDKYEMWLTYDSDKHRIRFPVLPEKVEYTYKDKNDSVFVADLGEVLIKRPPGSFSIKFSSHFPAVAHQGSISNPKDPDEYVDFMLTVMEIKKPAKYIFTGGAYPVSTQCHISFQMYEQGGDVGTIYYTITITHTEVPSVRKIKVKKGSKKAKAKKKSKRANTKVKSSNYTVKANDSLSKISKSYYGTTTKWKTIYNVNKKVIGSNPNKLKAGTKLTIPKS